MTHRWHKKTRTGASFFPELESSHLFGENFGREIVSGDSSVFLPWRSVRRSRAEMLLNFFIRHRTFVQGLLNEREGSVRLTSLR